MCAVRVENQLGCETRRRRWQLSGQLVLLLQLLLAICLHGSCGTSADKTLGIGTPWPDTTLDDCHDDYMLASENASSTFYKEYELCELEATNGQLNLTINEQLEREQIELGRSQLCGSFAQCDSHDDDLEYFECIRNNGNRNLDLITEINYNSTSAHTRLRQDYDTVYQTLMLCTLDAKVMYINSMRRAYEELHECRSEADNSAD
ncbi:uncharacterized protein LOC115758577 [Drosophila novamexicana]|uniref:uncharacterized protein LOC115758577 n=1 Tax=Drosophila novamexicana TaxID=47314 RepID=UPI0011E5A765|nr:uncharacterized protein LOC115758577 [Drosophila novamexicana]